MPKASVLRRHAKQATRRVHGRAPHRVSPTSLDLFRAITSNGRRRPGLYDPADYFYHIPRVWGRSTRDPNRVLFCGTSVQCQQVDEAKLIELARHRGILNPVITYNSQVGSFWSRFYGCDNYVENKARTIPALMIATGLMRNYNYLGGETMEVDDALSHFAALNRVPFVVISVPNR